MKKLMLNKKGFSLVELIIVIAIMSILSAAIAPAIIVYIDKARKARDVEVAQTIYDAAGLAMTTSEDNAYYGWTVCYDEYQTTRYPAMVIANNDGTPVKWDNQVNTNTQPGEGQYKMRPVAWARGVKYNVSYGQTYSWQNTLFKSTLDTGAISEKQRNYTDEFLYCMSQEMAQGGNNNNRIYDGESEVDMTIKYNKKIDCLAGPYKGTKVSPELWILYRRDDSGAAEVWTGYKKSGSNIAPLYRVYPDPAKAYK